MADKIIDKQLTKLQTIANEFNLLNVNNINWTLIASSTSDGAATQTKLIKDFKVKGCDERTYGVPDTSLKLINVACM